MYFRLSTVLNSLMYDQKNITVGDSAALGHYVSNELLAPA